MALYAIGDVQGCMAPLRELLSRLNFDPIRDRLWFTGDLVNRGPDSAEVLRFVRSLGKRAITVLGNHDLHLLAVSEGAVSLHPADTFADVLNAPDGASLLAWLAMQPLLHYEATVGALVHAGIPPSWNIAEALQHAHEAESVLRQGAARREFFQEMYGDDPRAWSEKLRGFDRLRFVVNAFTRIRFCGQDGSLDFEHKGPPGSQGEGLVPWFQVPDRRTRAQPVVFGHWSLLGLWDGDNAIGLDTGCLWGRALTAVRLSPGARSFISVRCPSYASAGRENRAVTRHN